jgi:nicotinate-nucleotide adenylyltransferase
MKLGIFGGTFDPPHLGHLILAAAAQEQLGLNQVLWVLTPFPPHKKNLSISPLNDRLSMVLLAISGNRYFKLSSVDIDRQPPHYAVDTVNILRQEHNQDMFYYLMGADSLNDLPTWHAPVRFVEACDGLGIIRRTGDPVDTSNLETQIPGLSTKLHFLDTPVIEISGSDIRLRVMARRQFRYLVPEKVYRYILNYKLYQG